MTRSRDLTGEVLGPYAVHGGTTVIKKVPLRLTTSGGQWAYAVSHPLRTDGEAYRRFQEFGARVVADLSVIRGAVGVGVTNDAGDAFIVEKFTGDARSQTSLLIPAGKRVGAVIIRNASASGASEFVVNALRVESLEGAFVYPVSATTRTFEQEAVPPGGDSHTVFDTDAAHRLNAARKDWVAGSGLVPPGSRVLDAGAGVGHFLPLYLDRGCTVVAVDGREDNIAELKRRFPGVEAHVADVQRFDLSTLGRFDVIHSFGLLYHLESPVAALRSFRSACRGRLILETMVCDSASPVSVIEDETKAASQALDGLGCRPSPAFVALALNRVGFRYVYGADPPPRHEEFQFTWANDMATVRNGHPLRCVFVASDEPIDQAPLFPVID